MEASANLGLPYIMPSQAQKHVTHNEAIRMLDALVQLSVIDRDRAEPPEAPAEGDRHVVAAGATGAWSGKTDNIAAYQDGGWAFFAPAVGWIAWLAEDAGIIMWTGSAWTPFTETLGTLQNLALLGIGTTADATNPFAAKLNKALWTARTAAEGGDGDLRYTLNKETAADVLSLLLQTGFSGRAELGLIGDDSFTLKVSADGSAWTTALSVDRATGLVTLAGDPAAALGVATRQFAVARAGDTMTGALTLPNGSASAPALAIGAAGTGWRRDPANARLSASVDGIEQGWFNRGGKLALRKRMLIAKPNIVLRNHLTGAAWLTSASAADNQWRGLAWAPEPGLFCAVAVTGSGNRVMTSPNGVTWTARTSAADNDWYAVCWSPELSLFCATAITGTGNRVMTSPDGISWTLRSSAADNEWRAVCWASEPGLFCAVAASGTGNRVMTSPDGVTWTACASAANNNWQAVAWSPELGLFCAVASTGTGNRVMTSPDGVTWTARTSAADNQWRGLAWSPDLGLFCATAVSGSGNRVMTSPDGVAWTARASASDNDWYGAAWAPETGLFCAVAATGTGNRVMTSPDGVAWTTRSSAADNQWTAVAWSPELGLFSAAAISGTGDRAMTSRSAYSFGYRS